MTAVEFQPMNNETDVCIKRIGHSSSELHGNHIVVTIGGFGEQEGKHKRLTNLSLLDLQTNDTCDIGLDVGDDVESKSCHVESVNQFNYLTWFLQMLVFFTIMELTIWI